MEMRAKFLEPEVNREASNYIVKNYEEIVRQIPKFGVHPDKAQDLLNDVYVSIVEAEDEGDGYDMNRATNGDCILVSQFVYGRIKGYSWNTRYRTNVVEMRSNKKDESKEVIVVAGCASENIDELSSFQRAYALASTDTDLDVIELETSIVEEIEYCTGFDEIVGMSFLSILKNIDILVSEEINKTILDPLKEAIREHEEFGEAFRNILVYSMKNRQNFERILQTI